LTEYFANSINSFAVVGVVTIDVWKIFSFPPSGGARWIVKWQGGVCMPCLTDKHIGETLPSPLLVLSPTTLHHAYQRDKTFFEVFNFSKNGCSTFRGQKPQTPENQYTSVQNDILQQIKIFQTTNNQIVTKP
jgi:hypothetical protein